MGAPIDRDELDLNLNLLRPFVTVYENGSFSSAAQQLGVPRSTVSRAVAALEDATRVVLFRRNTRNVTATREGRELYDRVAPRLAELRRAIAERPARQDGPSGTLRLTTTSDLGRAVLAEPIARFLARYPAVNVEVHLSTQVVDLVRQGYDAAVRVSMSRLKGATLVARKIGVLELGLYAAPALLAREGPIRDVGDLRALSWVGFWGAPPLQVRAPAVRELIASRARVITDDMAFVRQMLRLGTGVGALPSFMAADDLTQGLLVAVLPRFVLATAGVHFVHAGGRHVPARVTAFRDLLIEFLRQRPLA